MKILSLAFAFALSACVTEATVVPPLAPPTASPAPGDPSPQTLGTVGPGSSTGGGCLRAKTPCHP